MVVRDCDVEILWVRFSVHFMDLSINLPMVWFLQGAIALLILSPFLCFPCSFCSRIEICTYELDGQGDLGFFR